jgi:hypothetical protein
MGSSLAAASLCSVLTPRTCGRQGVLKFETEHTTLERKDIVLVKTKHHIGRAEGSW